MRKRKIVASLIFIYNLIGFITVLGLYPDDPFYWDGSIYLLLFTFPITIIGFGFRYAESNCLFIVVLIQLIILATTLFIGDFTTRNLIKRVKKE